MIAVRSLVGAAAGLVLALPAPAGAHWEIALRAGQSIDPVVELLRGRGLSLRHLVEKRQSLEEAFLQTVDADGPGDVPTVAPVVLAPASARP